MTRILVTGSRGWTDFDAILFALLRHTKGGPATMVHGDCKDGADEIADRIGVVCGFTVERHPAIDHSTQDFGGWPGAGPRRNAYMVGLGADVCLAFIGRCVSPKCKTTESHPSHGTSGTAKLAEAAGIRVERFYA